MTDVRMVSYADNAGDVVLVRAFADRMHGFFVDVGAGHPVVGSVVKNLSDLLWWNGIHIEPNPHMAGYLREAYPDDQVVEELVADCEGVRTFYSLKKSYALSTLNARIGRMYEAERDDVTRVALPGRSLDEILQANEAPIGFDLLKIDVEGTEEDVLRGVDLDYWRPRLILVEATLPLSTVRSDTDWTALVESFGYEMCLFDGLNLFFARREETALSTRASIPSNVFDDFIPYRWWCRFVPEQRPGVSFAR